MVKLKNILDFLIFRKWQKDSEKVSKELPYDYYIAPANVDVSPEYRLAIYTNENAKHFDRYAKILVSTIVEIYDGKYLADDLYEIFSKDSSVLSLRIIDKDTEFGSIAFNRLVTGWKGLERILFQAINFFISKEPIFAKTDVHIIEKFVEECRALSTAKGSYITKISIPDKPIQADFFNKIDPVAVAEMLLNILDFFNFMTSHERIEDFSNGITSEHLSQYKENINVELFESLVTFLKNVNIIDIEFTSFGVKNERMVSLKEAKNKAKFFGNYTAKIKELLMELTPLECIGFITELKSQSPSSASHNKVLIEGRVANVETKINVTLNPENYQLAIDAHKNEMRVKIKGMAKQNKDSYTIGEVTEFKVL